MNAETAIIELAKAIRKMDTAAFAEFAPALIAWAKKYDIGDRESLGSTGDGDPVEWVQGHFSVGVPKAIWHRADNPDGLNVLCGWTTPGAPTVCRQSMRWEPEPLSRCAHCEAAFVARFGVLGSTGDEAPEKGPYTGPAQTISQYQRALEAAGEDNALKFTAADEELERLRFKMAEIGGVVSRELKGCTLSRAGTVFEEIEGIIRGDTMGKTPEGPRLVSEPVWKEATCKSCGAAVEYLPEHVETGRRSLMGKEYEDWERVKCPREGCEGYAYIKG